MALGRAGTREDAFVRVSRGLVYVGIFFLPLLHFKLTHGLNLSDAVFAAATVLLLLSRRPPKQAPRTPAWYVGAFIFVLAGVVATVNADAKAQSLIVVGNAVYVFFVLQYLLRQLLDTPERMQRAMAAFVLATSVSALVAIFQVEFHAFIFTSSPSGAIGGNLRAIGLSTQPNYAGVSFALGIVFALGLVVDLGLRRHRYLGACIAVLAAALLLSGSVGGMASAAVGCFVLFISRGFKLRTVVTVLLSFAVVYVLIFGVIDRGSKLDPITRIEKTTNARSGQGTLSLRIDTVKQAWGDVVQSPFVGHGLDQQTFDLYFDRYIYVYYAPHDFIVLYWYGGGIFMLVGVLIMMGSSFNRLLNGRRRRGHTMRDTVLAACVTAFFFSLQGPSFIDRWLWFPFILALCFRDPETPAPLVADELTVANGRPRRVAGIVGRRDGPEMVDGAPVGRGRHAGTTGRP